MLTDSTTIENVMPSMPVSGHKECSRGKTRTFDVALGARVKFVRQLRGISQEKLADHLGLTFQQVQKYETGANRFPVARLVETARFLGATAAFLLGEAEGTEADHLVTGLAERRDILRLLPRLISADPKQVRAVSDLIDTFNPDAGQ